jgi:predicted negative regulator of RcsB-dependent stress response
MATSLDLQEQEQLDALKSYWKKNGDRVTWLLVLVLGAFAAWNGWNWYQREQGTKAGALYDELERAAQANDPIKTSQVFADLKQRFPSAAFTRQGALMTAKVQAERGQADAARATLAWAAEQSGEAELQTIARLRLAALQSEAKQYDEALKTLEPAKAAGFEALVADRRGDVLLSQGKKPEAQAAYEVAYAAMAEKQAYRRLIEAKLTALGATPGRAASAAAAAPVAANATAAVTAAPPAPAASR